MGFAIPTLAAAFLLYLLLIAEWWYRERTWLMVTLFTLTVSAWGLGAYFLIGAP